MSRVVDSEARRAAVSAGVWRVMAEQGLEALSLRNVAAAAGCTTGMVLHYFTDRRELLLHARRLMHDRLLARVTSVSQAAADPRAALREVLAQSLPLDAERLAEARIWLGFLAAAVHEETLAAEHTAHHRGWQRRLCALVRAARPDLSAARARSQAQRLAALTDGMTALAVVDPVSYSARRQRELLDNALAEVFA